MWIYVQVTCDINRTKYSSFLAFSPYKYPSVTSIKSTPHAVSCGVLGVRRFRVLHLNGDGDFMRLGNPTSTRPH
jgi:hypothetical protein